MNTPTLQELQTAVLNAFEDRFGTINRGIRSTFRVISQVLSGQLKQLYLTAARVQKNIFPDLAEPEAYGGTLERFGRARLGRDPFPPSQGVYLVDVAGQIGGVIRSGLTFRANNGLLYSNETTFTFTSTSGQVSLRALTAGLDAQLIIGDSLTATEPILNVDQNATVNAEVTAPLDGESIEDYRNLIIQSFRIEAQGGASGDYRIWAGDAQGVSRVYPYVGNPGQINIYVEATAADSGGTYIPNQTILDNVQAVVELDPDTTKNINERGRLPLDVWEINYLPIVPITIDVNITGYTGNIGEDSPIIEIAIMEYMYTVRPYIAGADEMDKSRLSINKVIGVVSDAVTGDFTAIELLEGITPITIRQFTDGDIPVLGTLNIIV